MSGNRIFRGSIAEQPKTISKPVTGALLPGTFVTIGASALAQATTPAGRVGILGSLDFYNQDALTAYTSGETGVAYRVEPDLEFQVAVAAGTYTFGQELTIGASGRLAAAVSTNVVVAFFDDASKAGVAQSAGALCDVVIANSYTKA